MKSVCLNFQLHQPFRYRKYRFFDIGNDAYYYDDFANETFLRKVADQCYLPANKIILDLIRKNNGKFKVTFTTDETQDIRLVISNTIGQSISERKIENFNGAFNEEIDLSELSKGVYVVTIETNNGSHNSKVVVQ